VKRQMVAEMMTSHGLSERRACGLIDITRRSLRREPPPNHNGELRELLRSNGRRTAMLGLSAATPSVAPRAP